ncbi:MAG: hypothetical protein ACRENE_18150 [Polyangiaceae bacterium]
MAALKKTAKPKTGSKAASKRAAAARPKLKPARKPSPIAKAPARKAATKKKALPKGGKRAPKKGVVKTQARPVQPQVPPPRVLAAKAKSFADRVRDREVGIGVWFITAGSVEHASIQGWGAEDTARIRTDAGVVEVVPSTNLFETADEARAARDLNLP